MIAKLVLGISAVALLAGCDPGRKSYNMAEQMYLDAAKDGLTIEEDQDVKLAYITAAAVADVHSKHPSGEKAAKLLERIQKDVKAFYESSRPALDAEMEKFAIAMKVAQDQTDKLFKESAKKPKRKYNAPFPFKEGDCFVTTSGKEFSKESSLFEVELKKVEKLGTDKALIKTLYQSRKGNFPANWRAELEQTPAEEEYKSAVEDELKIPCARAEQLITDFQKAMDVGSVYNPKINRFNGLMEAVGFKSAP